MTSTLERPGLASGGREPVALPGERLLAHVPVLAALGVAALRVPTLLAAPGADEAGFLVVARHWGPGTSLYGDYWVDRPPLLITLYRLADVLGGVVALRVIGTAAAVLVVLGTAVAARRVVELHGAPGPAASSQRTALRAAAGAALVAGALCVSPLMGSIEANGELLAAPFVAVGLAALLGAVSATGRPRTAYVRAGLAGAALAAAVLVKQNQVDLGVAAAVLLAVGVLRGELTAGRALRLAAALLGGLVACGAAVAGWTVLHGTSLGGVYEAMYPFRLAASRVLAASGSVRPELRRGHLVVLVLLSGVPLLGLATAAALVARRVGGTAVWALLATAAWAAVSIDLGGSFWAHYLVELDVPVSVLAGVVLAARQPGARWATAVVVASALVAWAAAMPGPTSPGSAVGRAVQAAACPGDTIVTVFGHAEVTGASGLSSPYPYLWSLPMRVRDPHARLLARTLSGAAAPTWFVAYTHLGTGPIARAVRGHYRRDADLGGHTVYLHDGVARPTPSYATDHRPASTRSQP